MILIVELNLSIILLLLPVLKIIRILIGFNELKGKPKYSNVFISADNTYSLKLLILL